MQKLKAHSWPQSTSTSATSATTADQIAHHAKILLGCFRTGEANDPAIYSGAVIAVLSDYPLDVVRQVVDPRTGLPSRCKWLPTVAEIKQACEEIYGPIRFASQWEARARQQLADHNTTRLADQRPRKTLAEHADDLARHGIYIAGRKPAGDDTSISSVRDRYGITQEAWDAIPDAERA